jgi:hypothetical protein
MKRSATAISIIIPIVVIAAQAQSSAPKPAPVLRMWDLWGGSWTMVGTAKDSPTGPEYKLNWRWRSRWILGGFFMELDHKWKGNGAEQHWLEVLFYDPAKKTNAISGFASDGTTWTGTATFNGGTSVENFTLISPDGKIATCLNNWVITADQNAVSGTSQCEQDGVRWTSFEVKGTKVKTGVQRTIP